MSRSDKELGLVGRVFSGDKIVDSYSLNCLGAQVFRTIAARGVYNAVPVSVSGIVKEKFTELEREGMVAWPNFLPRDEFERVKRECGTLVRNRSQVKVKTWGANRMESVPLREVEVGALSGIQRLMTDGRLREVLVAAEKRSLGNLSDYASVQRLVQGPGENSVDAQTQIHSDIFFNCHKVWFYLSDVGLEDGPLFYIKGSHKLTPRQLLHVYKWSTRKRDTDDPSRRVTAEELAKMGQGKEICTCVGNTLVIVNVCGYHGRLQGEVGRERLAVYIPLRADPFRVLMKDRLRTAFGLNAA